MSNKVLIDKILEENYIPLRHTGVRLAMEQAITESYDVGYTRGWSEGFISADTNSRELLKAQKELIGLHEKLSETDFITSKEWDRMDELRTRIKDLEN